MRRTDVACRATASSPRARPAPSWRLPAARAGRPATRRLVHHDDRRVWWTTTARRASAALIARALPGRSSQTRRDRRPPAGGHIGAGRLGIVQNTLPRSGHQPHARATRPPAARSLSSRGPLSRDRRSSGDQSPSSYCPCAARWVMSQCRVYATMGPEDRNVSATELSPAWRRSRRGCPSVVRCTAGGGLSAVSSTRTTSWSSARLGRERSACRHDGTVFDAELAGWDPTTAWRSCAWPGSAPPVARATHPAHVGHLRSPWTLLSNNVTTAPASSPSSGATATGRHRAIEEVIRTTAPHMTLRRRRGRHTEGHDRLTTAAIRGLAVVIAHA